MFRLELKTIADVGLVGFPQRGKEHSSLRLTSARPKIANHHFTTLTPNLGIARRYETEFVLADIPGLVEGAEQRAWAWGMTSPAPRGAHTAFAHVVDASGERGALDPLEDSASSMRSWPGTASGGPSPAGGVPNNATWILRGREIQRLKQAFEELGYEAFPRQRQQNRGFDALLDRGGSAPGGASAAARVRGRGGGGEPRSPGRRLHHPPREQHLLRRGRGHAALLWTASTSTTRGKLLNWFHRTLRDRGIIQALRDKGAGEGSTVSIGDMEFDFIE